MAGFWEEAFKRTVPGKIAEKVKADNQRLNTAAGRGEERARETTDTAYSRQSGSKRPARDDNSEKDRPTTATVAPPVAAAPVASVAAPVASMNVSAAGAAPAMAEYDAYTKAGMGETPAETMAKANAAAAQVAQEQSDAAIRQAVKGARTAGAMPGQAALAATGSAADAYGTGKAAGTAQYFDATKLGATLGSEMSQRLARAEATQAGRDASSMAAKAQKDAADQAFWGNIIQGGIGAAGGIASLFSDENLKDDIEPDDMTRGLEEIRGYTYKYKGAPRGEAGVMAQDLERTAMAPAVMDTPEGKMVDTRRLSTMNTAALSSHEKRLKDIERLVKEIGSLPSPKKGE